MEEIIFIKRTGLGFKPGSLDLGDPVLNHLARLPP